MSSLVRTVVFSVILVAHAATAANAIVSLPLTQAGSVTNLGADASSGGISIAEQDALRSAALFASSQGADDGLAGLTGAVATSGKLGGSVQTSATGSIYIVTVTVGTAPSTPYQLLLDTGSSNTWIGARSSYVKSATTVPSSPSQNLTVTYGLGSVSGVLFSDTLAIGGLTIANQALGAATTSSSFSRFGVDGILGLGPSRLTVGRLLPATKQSTPTITDNLLTQGLIGQAIVGVYLTPTLGATTGNGQVTFGGIDPSKNSTAYFGVPASTTNPAARYFSSDITLSAGDSFIADGAPGIIDTGTSLVVIASDFFDAYLEAVQEAVPGAAIDPKNGMLSVPTASVASVPALGVGMGGRQFDLIADATFLPESSSLQYGGSLGKRYSVVTSSKRASGAGFDITLGMKWLERYATAYDSSTNIVSVASTRFTSMLYSQIAATAPAAAGASLSAIGPAQIAPAPAAQTVSTTLTRAGATGEANVANAAIPTPGAVAPVVSTGSRPTTTGAQSGSAARTGFASGTHPIVGSLLVTFVLLL